MFITIGDATLYTTSFGPKSAPAILAISGWIGSWEDWADTLSHLSENNWRLISFDHRGSGASIAPVETITLDNLVADVFAVLDSYEIERCVLAAMSMGAAIALSAALQQPERFSGLVIVNGAYYRETPLEQDSFYQALQTDYSQALDLFVGACVPEPDSDPVRRWGRQIIDRASPMAALALYRLGSFIDMRNDLHRIEMPALILHGTADTLVALDSSRALAENLPDARLALIEAVGHVPIMTRPNIVAREINEFFGTQI